METGEHFKILKGQGNIDPPNDPQRCKDGKWTFHIDLTIGYYAKEAKKVYACFVDFTKFYDTVSHNLHDLLFIKFLEKGITGNFYFLLKNMYNNCKYAVKVQLLTYEDSDTFIKRKANNHVRYRWFESTFMRSIAGLK